MRKIHSNYSGFSRRCVGQRYDHSIGVYDFAYVRSNRAQNLPQIEARRDFGRQIEEQLKPLLLMPKFPFSAHGRMRSTTHFVSNTFDRMMIHVALKSQVFASILDGGLFVIQPGEVDSFLLPLTPRTDCTWKSQDVALHTMLSDGVADARHSTWVTNTKGAPDWPERPLHHFGMVFVTSRARM